MSQTLTISDELYQQLALIASQRGLASIEQLLEAWQASEAELRNRQQAVERIDAVREQIFQRYGELPDSVDLLREDRAR
jgi:hypothetical protein